MCNTFSIKKKLFRGKLVLKIFFGTSPFYFLFFLGRRSNGRLFFIFYFFKYLIIIKGKQK